MKKIKLFLIIFIFLWIFSCQNEENFPEKNFENNSQWSQKQEITGDKNISKKIDWTTENNNENISKICVKNPEIKVFMYHYVRHDDPSDSATIRDLSVTPENFESHMKIIRTLADEGKIFLMNGKDFAKSFSENCFPHEKIWLFTADDGWIDTATELAPLTEEYQIPFIFGIIAGKLDAKNFVSSDDVKNFAKNPLFTIASHTITHREHNGLTDADEKKEICESKEILENLTGENVDFFIYPVGKIGASSVKYLKEYGYIAAWSTSRGKNLDWKNPEPYIMNRVRIHHDTGAKFFENHAK